MNKRTAYLLGLVALIGMPSCVTQERHMTLQAANEALQDQIADITRTNKDYQSLIAKLRAEVSRMGPLVKDAKYLAEQKALVDSILKRYNTEGGPSLPTGVSPVQVADGLALRVEGRVLFGSGSDKLSPSGESTLAALVATIRSHPGKVRVSGHTDNEPIRRSSWKTNMRLSVARALAVREYLVGKGLSGDKLSVAGYGEFEPVDPNDKAKNRRTEIVLLR